MLRRRPDSRVFFPWERKRATFGLLGPTRARMGFIFVVAAASIFFLHKRESHLASVRATRAAISTAERAVASYRADHNGSCPRELADLVTGGYMRDGPTDAWGRPLRLTCPGRRDPKGFDVWSDGPDGLPGGVDRVE
jgi:general secretion pathway protein G